MDEGSTEGQGLSRVPLSKDGRVQGSHQPWGIGGGPAVQEGGGRRGSGLEGSPHLLVQGGAIVGCERLLRGSAGHQHGHVQQTPDNELRLKQVLTLILEALRQEGGGCREEGTARAWSAEPPWGRGVDLWRLKGLCSGLSTPTSEYSEYTLP